MRRCCLGSSDNISNPKSRRGKPRAREKDNVEAGRVATLGEGANFGEKGNRKSRHIRRRSQFWREGRRRFGWRRGQCGAQILKVNLCRRLIAFLRFCIFSMRMLMIILRLGFLNEGKIGKNEKKMKETMLVKGKSIVLE